MASKRIEHLCGTRPLVDKKWANILWFLESHLTKQWWNWGRILCKSRGMWCIYQAGLCLPLNENTSCCASEKVEIFFQSWLRLLLLQGRGLKLLLVLEMWKLAFDSTQQYKFLPETQPCRTRGTAWPSSIYKNDGMITFEIKRVLPIGSRSSLKILGESRVSKSCCSWMVLECPWKALFTTYKKFSRFDHSVEYKIFLL